MNRRIIAAGLLLALTCGLAQAQAVDFWRPMLHAEALLDTLPAHAVHFSSYDRNGGGSDLGHYYGTDRGWNILADLRGPGVIGDFWCTARSLNDTDRVRIFVDDTVNALIDTPIARFFGEMSPFLPPLADSAEGAWFCYVPIPYQNLARITYKGAAIFFHVTALSFPAGTTISRFAMPPTTDYQSRLDSLVQRFEYPDAPSWASRTHSSLSSSQNVQPSQSAVLIDRAGRGGCRKLYLRIPNHTQAVLENVWIRIYTDHYVTPDIEGPLSSVFGLAQGWHPYRSVYNGAVGDSLYLNLPIPFISRFRVEVENRTGTAQSVSVIAEIADLPTEGFPQMKTVGIHHEENPNRMWQGFELANVDGPGTFLGAALDMQPTNSICYEGDESMWIDGETTPSWIGTGTEDYFNAGWYWLNGTACTSSAFHGCVNWWWQWAGAYRWQVTNPVAFHSHFRMALEVGPWNNLTGHYRSMAFFAVARNPWQVADADGDGQSFPAESLRVVGQSLIPGVRLLNVTLGGEVLSRLAGDTVVSTDSVMDVTVAAPGGALDGDLALIANTTIGSFTVAPAWQHHSVPQLRFVPTRCDVDSFAFVGDTLNITIQGLLPGANADILAGAILSSWVNTSPVADTQGELTGRVTVPRTLQTGDHPLTASSANRPQATCANLLKLRPFFRLEIEELTQTSVQGTSRTYFAPDYLPGGVTEPWGRNIARRIQGTDTTAFGQYAFYIPDSGNYRISYFLGRTGAGAIVRAKIDSSSIDVAGFDSYFATPGLWRWTRSDTVRGNWRPLNRGWHSARFEIAGRNASASGWEIILDQMVIERGTLPPSEPLAVPVLVCFPVAEGLRLCWGRVTVDTAGLPVNIDAYKIYRSVNPESTMALIAAVAGTDSSFLDTDSLTDGRVVSYYVTASIGATQLKSRIVPASSEEVGQPWKPRVKERTRKRDLK